MAVPRATIRDEEQGTRKETGEWEWEGDRDTENEEDALTSNNLSPALYIYIYIYVYICNETFIDVVVVPVAG